jgi:hypothetical protein
MQAAAVHPLIRGCDDRIRSLQWQQRAWLVAKILSGAAACAGIILLPLGKARNVAVLTSAGTVLVGTGLLLSFCAWGFWSANEFGHHGDREQLQFYRGERQALGPLIPQWQEARRQLETTLLQALPGIGLQAPVDAQTLRTIIAQQQEPQQASQAWQAQQFRLRMLLELVVESRTWRTNSQVMQTQLEKWRNQLAQIQAAGA